jgi:hypothetical protein
MEMNEKSQRAIGSYKKSRLCIARRLRRPLAIVLQALVWDAEALAPRLSSRLDGR